MAWGWKGDYDQNIDVGYVGGAHAPPRLAGIIAAGLQPVSAVSHLYYRGGEQLCFKLPLGLPLLAAMRVDARSTSRLETLFHGAADDVRHRAMVSGSALGSLLYERAYQALNLTCRIVDAGATRGRLAHMVRA